MATKYTGYAIVEKGTTELKTTIHPIDGGTIYRVFTTEEEAYEATKNEHGKGYKYDVLPINLEFPTE